MNPDQPFSHALLTPCKTLWFEFLLTPDLLHKHLNQKNPDPNPIELIISFLNNINPSNGSSSASTVTNQGNDENLSYNSGSSIVNPEGSNSSSAENGINSNSKKYLGIKLLALKVAAFLRYDLEVFEQNLPITMQFTLLDELIKICDTNSGNNCTLFAYINYYRWILRSVIKLSYPSRKSYSIPVPLLQQIDPCYLPHETIEIWFNKLRELSTTAVNGLEKVIKENELKEITNILMPNFDCFKTFDEELNEINFDWQQVTKLNTSEIMDTIKFELGKWFFFNENYTKAASYFNKIILTQLKKEKFVHLEDFKKSANGMVDDKRERELIDDLNQVNINDSLDLSRFEQTKEQNKLYKELNLKFNENQTDKHVIMELKSLCYYLSLKLPNCSKELLKYTSGLEMEDQMEYTVEPTKQSNINTEDIFQNELEFKLIEATDPETILNLVTKIHKTPPEINKLWELPKIYLICLKNVKNLTQQQHNRCFFILAKAFELRNAKFYFEARTLFLSLFEDIQTSMQHMAELITYEILLTDLEILAESKDKDERKIGELIKKCEDVLIKEETISDILPQLMQHCCIFLLEFDVPILKDYLQSNNMIMRLTSSLYCIKNSGTQTAAYANDLWDNILNAFLDFKNQNQPNFGKKRKLQIPKSNVLTVNMLISYVNNLNSLNYICILTACLAKLHNLIKDNQGAELSSFSCILFPNNTVGVNANLFDLNLISLVLKLLLNKALKQSPNDIAFIKCRAELALVENEFHESLRNFLKILIITTDYFRTFKLFENEPIIQKMIVCSTKLGCYTQAAVLHQMTREINYQLVFKALGERICYDSCDDLYDCIWDLAILEFLVNMHCKKGEIDRKIKVVRLIGQLELNANNADEIRREASNIRRGKFFRYMAKKYL